MGKDDAAIEGRWTKEEVANIVCREDNEGTTILSLMDFETQKELAFWQRERTIEVAHLLGAKFLQWLIDQALDGRWSQEDVSRVVCRRDSSNQLILSTLDEEIQKKVAVFNPAKTCNVVPYMDAGFLEWLYQEAEEGRWDKQMVFKALTKEEVDGKVNITTRIKSGSKIAL